mgnify:CR=1 FL=1
MPDITDINGVALSGITDINGVAKANITDINGVDIPGASATLILIGSEFDEKNPYNENNPLVVDIHSSAAVGDLGVLMCATDNPFPVNGFADISGWTTEILKAEPDGVRVDTEIYCAYKILTASDISAGSVNVPYDTDLTFIEGGGYMHIFRNFDTSTPVATADNFNSNSTSSITTPAVTSVVGGFAYAFTAFDGGDGDPVTTSTSGWTMESFNDIGTGGLDLTVAIATKNDLCTTTSTGTMTFNFNASDQARSVMIFIYPE